MKLENLFLAILSVAMVVNYIFDHEGYKRDIDASNELEKFNQSLMFRIIQTDVKIDSLREATMRVAEATMYLDSCQQVKSSKSERAERRGRFVGGLLRGLIPGI